METLLVKIFATALTLSRVMTQPQALKTQFDPVRDQDEVVQMLRAGCAHMRRAVRGRSASPWKPMRRTG